MGEREGGGVCNVMEVADVDARRGFVASNERRVRTLIAALSFLPPLAFFNNLSRDSNSASCSSSQHQTEVSQVRLYE